MNETEAKCTGVRVLVKAGIDPKMSIMWWNLNKQIRVKNKTKQKKNTDELNLSPVSNVFLD